MKLRIKRLVPEAVIPKYAKPGDAGLDLTAVSKEYDAEIGCLIYGTGLALEIPEGHVGLIFPRSSVCKTNLSMTNCVGVIDSGYRGEVKAVFARTDKKALADYNIGDRIGQLLILPYPKVEVVEELGELSPTDRGDGGFGSSGR